MRGWLLKGGVGLSRKLLNLRGHNQMRLGVKKFKKCNLTPTPYTIKHRRVCEMSNATKLSKFKGYVKMLSKTFIITSVESYVSETYKYK